MNKNRYLKVAILMLLLMGVNAWGQSTYRYGSRILLPEFDRTTYEKAADASYPDVAVYEPIFAGEVRFIITRPDAYSVCLHYTDADNSFMAFTVNLSPKSDSMLITMGYLNKHTYFSDSDIKMYLRQCFLQIDRTTARRKRFSTFNHKDDFDYNNRSAGYYNFSIKRVAYCKMANYFVSEYGRHVKLSPTEDIYLSSRYCYPKRLTYFLDGELQFEYEILTPTTESDAAQDIELRLLNIGAFSHNEARLIVKKWIDGFK